MYGGKSIGLACSGKEIYHFCFVLLLEGKFQVQAPRGGLYSEGIIHGGVYFRNFRYVRDGPPEKLWGCVIFEPQFFFVIKFLV